MRKRYVLVMTAANRVGILAAVANAIAEVGGELVEIRQTVLQGFFTMIIAADFPADREAGLIRQHVGAACQRYGVEVTLRDPETEALPAGRDGEMVPHVLSLEGTDEPGAMRSLSAQLASRGIDISEMHAVRGEEGRFRAVLQLAVPVSVASDELREDLVSLGDRMGLATRLDRSPSPQAAAARSGRVPLKG